MSSEHHLAHEAEHEGLEHAHPKPKTYALIGLVLAIITMAEVWAYTQPSVRPILVPILLVLSACKFAMVVGAYMLLRLVHPVFLGLVGFVLSVAVRVITVL